MKASLIFSAVLSLFTFGFNFGFTFGFSFGAGAFAQESFVTPQNLAQARCFEFQIQSPANTFAFKRPHIIGCYLELAQDEHLVFVKDEDGADWLTSALVSQSKADPTRESVNLDHFSVEHFSKSGGEVVKITQESLQINPLPIPLTIQLALDSPQYKREVSDLSIFSDSLRSSINDILKSFTRKSLSALRISSKDISELSRLPEDLSRQDSSFLPDNRQPDDGHWWPHNNYPLANGPNSPLAKYDAYVEKITGQNPKSAEWEKKHHNTDTVWAGHCNGWAASSILHGYHDKDLLDPANGNIITSSDLQGLRAETSFCVHSVFYGTRYSGPANNIGDIHPEEFIKTLKYYILLLQKPVVIDYLSAEPVDNHIVSGYSISYEPRGRNKYLGKIRLRMHGYNYTKVRVKQVARVYQREYFFWAWKDSRGNIMKSEWVDPFVHPDFVWVPLKETKCGGENPRTDHKYIDHMIKYLKSAPPGRAGRL